MFTFNPRTLGLHPKRWQQENMNVELINYFWPNHGKKESLYASKHPITFFSTLWPHLPSPLLPTIQNRWIVLHKQGSNNKPRRGGQAMLEMLFLQVEHLSHSKFGASVILFFILFLCKLGLISLSPLYYSLWCHYTFWSLDLYSALMVDLLTKRLLKREEIKLRGVWIIWLTLAPWINHNVLEEWVLKKYLFGLEKEEDGRDHHNIV